MAKKKLKQKQVQTAMDRASQMMRTKMCDLPEAAIEFAKHLSKEYGFCGEIMLTAFAAYAQCVEKLPCKDRLYKAREEDYVWFKKFMKKDPI